MFKILEMASHETKLRLARQSFILHSDIYVCEVRGEKFSVLLSRRWKASACIHRHPFAKQMWLIEDWTTLFYIFFCILFCFYLGSFKRFAYLHTVAKSLSENRLFRSVSSCNALCFFTIKNPSVPIQFYIQYMHTQWSYIRGIV